MELERNQIETQDILECDMLIDSDTYQIAFRSLI